MIDNLTSFCNTCLKGELPFVVYRKPKEKELHAFQQDNRLLYTVENFKEQGFIFAPFDTNKASTLFPISHSQRHVFHFDEDLEGIPHKKVSSTNAEKQQHLQLVQDGINSIKSGAMKKVVLSRKHTEKIYQRDPLPTFKRLLHTYPNAFVYYWYHPKVGLWMGATPETLLSIKNRRLETMALAGTQPYRDDKDVVWGAKEQEEQALVTQAIVENLTPLLGQNVSINGPYTSRAGSLLHLKTEITAPVDVTKLPIKEIIQSLHPTPAICGLPKEKAQQFIRSYEGYDRDYYTGYLGELNCKETRFRSRSSRNIENRAYTSVKSTTSLFVNLRCMQWLGDEALIYVGGGITSGSVPEAEWKETENKMGTMYTILKTN